MEREKDKESSNIILDEEEQKKQDKKKNFLEALDTYYKLKLKYDEGIEKERNRIMKLPELSWKEKRFQYKKYRPKCVNCSRPVGTLFSVKVDKDQDKYATALCGDRENPCPLNIKISLGQVFNLEEDIQKDQLEISEHKKEIIVDKNDLLFGYIDSKTAVGKFDEIKEKMTNLINTSEFYMQFYTNIIDNPEKKAKLEQIQGQIYTNIENTRRLIREFEKTNNLQLVNDVVENYKNDMIPRLKELMDYKYAYSNVEYFDDKFHLIQKKYTIEEVEIDLGTVEQSVIMMRTGMKQEKKQEKNSVKINRPRLMAPEGHSDIEMDSEEELELKTKPKTEVESESESDKESDKESESGSDSEDEDRVKLKISTEEMPVKVDMELEKE